MIQKTYFKTKDYCKVKFVFNNENVDTVEILGLNDDWKDGIALSKKKDGSFSADISLPKDSRHTFKYFVNKKDWMLETEADGQEADGFGGNNSLLVI